LFAFEKLHHIAIPANDFSRLHAFYTRVLGLQAHPEKPNWLRAGDGFTVHLMRQVGSAAPLPFLTESAQQSRRCPAPRGRLGEAVAAVPANCWHCTGQNVTARLSSVSKKRRYTSRVFAIAFEGAAPVD
jgi:catechol 2,3-dioxygenase-like lactoylglutathione lyase family enzyme